MRAVVTAGGLIDGEYARIAGTTVKALARVRGETMLARAIASARGAGALSIAVVGNDDVRAACSDDVEKVVDAAESGSENVARALCAWPGNDSLLYVTSDLPYVTADGIEDFVTRASGRLAIALSESDDFERRFPGAPPFGIRIGRERVVNGGVFFLPAHAAERVRERAVQFFAARKRPWAMARLAGVDILMRFVLGMLGVDALEKRASRVLEMPVQAVRRCAPELAFDADGVDEYRYACAFD